MEATKVMQHLIGKTYPEIVVALSFDSDGSDCCGYADCEVLDELRHLDDLEQAILVDVVQYDYGDDGGHRVVVNFLFDLGKDREGLILGYDLSASSSSGWHYGAWAVLYYEGEQIAGASW